MPAPRRSRSAIPISAPRRAGAWRRRCAAPATAISFGASIFHSWFDGYIYEAPTGAIQDDLPVFQYRQADARYFGVELEGSVRVAEIGAVD